MVKFILSTNWIGPNLINRKIGMRCHELLSSSLPINNHFFQPCSGALTATLTKGPLASFACGWLAMRAPTAVLSVSLTTQVLRLPKTILTGWVDSLKNENWSKIFRIHGQPFQNNQQVYGLRPQIHHLYRCYCFTQEMDTNGTINSKTWQIATPRKCKHGTMIQMMFRPYFQVFNGSFFWRLLYGYIIIYIGYILAYSENETRPPDWEASRNNSLHWSMGIKHMAFGQISLY